MYYNREDLKIKYYFVMMRKSEKEFERMKSTGMIRRVDELGRIVLPAEIRQSMDIHVKDKIEIFTEGDKIVLQKYYPACIFCGNTEQLFHFREKRICGVCVASLTGEGTPSAPQSQQ